MIRTSGRLILSLLAGLFMAVSVAAPAQAEITEGDRSALNDMIRDYILANPEVVRKALINLADREERERVEQAMVALRKDSGDPILGNPEGSFTIYEFSDYNCGYCKRVFQPLQELIAGDDDIRLVVKEFPILSQTSVLAAQAGIAAQASYWVFVWKGESMKESTMVDCDRQLARVLVRRDGHE